jgi:UDP:flavonoid glycosyltransferase YjiC (YdhE family)
MRVLIASWGWASHFYPTVPLGWALRAAGHEVRVAGQPCLVGAITGAGLPAVGVGADIDFDELHQRLMAKLRRDEDGQGAPDWKAVREGAGARAARGLFVEIAEAMVGDMVDFARDWQPDIVVYEPTTYAAPITAAVLGVPSARHLWGVDLTGPGRDAEVKDLAGLCARFGVTEIEPLGTVTVDPCPPSMQVPGVYQCQNIRYVPYNGPAEVTDWLREPPARRRLCVTWGTTAQLLGPHMVVLPKVVEALAEVDAEVVFAVAPQHRELLGELPSNTRAVHDVPLHLLLPTCDALVQQGGSGTTLTAVHAGVPQLVLPAFPDQTLNARRLAATGAGTFLLREDASPAAILTQVNDLAENAERRAATQRLRAEMFRQPAASDVVSMLEQLADGKSAADAVQVAR